MVYGAIRLVLFWEAFTLDQIREHDLFCIMSPKLEIGHDPHLQCETCVLVSSFLVFFFLFFLICPFPLFSLFLILFSCQLLTVF